MAILVDDSGNNLVDQNGIALTDDPPAASGSLALMLRFHMSIILAMLVSLALT